MIFVIFFNILYLSVGLFVCMFVSNKCQNGWTNPVQIFCGTSGKVCGWAELKKLPKKIDKSAKICLFMFDNLIRENAADRATIKS